MQITPVAPEVHELEEMAARAEVRMTDALAKAGVASSTYWRWRKDGKEPLTRTVRKIKAAISELASAA